MKLATAILLYSVCLFTYFSSNHALLCLVCTFKPGDDGCKGGTSNYITACGNETKKCYTNGTGRGCADGEFCPTLTDECCQTDGCNELPHD